MKSSIVRIVTVAAIVALVAAFAISTFAFAAGPGGGQARSGGSGQHGSTYGPGDGSGPLGGGQFGSGPYCVDANLNGICDCLE